MANIRIETGKKGRPLTLDTKRELELLIESNETYKRNLASLRAQTRGYRGDVLGSPTELPSIYSRTRRILKGIEDGAIDVDAELIRQIKENVKQIQNVAKQTKTGKMTLTGVRTITNQIQSQYVSDIKRQMKNASKFEKDMLQKLIDKVTVDSKADRASKNAQVHKNKDFLLSNNYQDPMTTGRNYERVKKWAEKHSGKEMDMNEAWAYLLVDRAKNGLSDEI